jgi:catechol 2,3-dioxygenase-like lactoylglutathione lyase family enzyme
MIKAMHHTAISVTDLEESIRFYRDSLGMSVEWKIDHRQSETLERVVGLRDVDVSYAMMSGWGGRVELFQYHSPKGEPYPPDKPVSDRGITHIAFQVEEIHGLYERLRTSGVRFNSPPQVVRPGVTAAYFHDPDGVTLEFVQYEKA